MQLSLSPLVVPLVSLVSLWWAGLQPLSRDLWLSPSVLQEQAASHPPSLLAALDSYWCSSEGSQCAIPTSFSFFQLIHTSTVLPLLQPSLLLLSEHPWDDAPASSKTELAVHIASNNFCFLTLLFPVVSSNWSILQTLQQPLTGKWVDLCQQWYFLLCWAGIHNVARDMTVLFCCWWHDSMYTWHCRAIHAWAVPDLWCISGCWNQATAQQALRASRAAQRDCIVSSHPYSAISAPTFSRLASGEVWPAGLGKWFFPLLLLPHLEECSHFWAL